MKTETQSFLAWSAVALSLVILGLLVGLAISELTLRLLDVSPQSLLSRRELRPGSQARARTRITYHCFGSNPHGEFEPAPDVTRGSWELFDSMLPPTRLPLDRLAETPWCVKYEVWNGPVKLRDWHPPRRPRDRLERIVLIGDSFVRGVGVPSHLTLSSQLQRALGMGGLEVLNAGAPGADLSREVQISRKVINKLDPLAVIVVFIPNDIQLSASLEARQDYLHDLILIRDQYLTEHKVGTWYAGRLRVVRLFGSYLEMRRITRETIDWYLDSYDPRHNAEGLEQLAADLSELARMDGCEVNLVLFPLLAGLERGNPLASVHEKVARLAREAGLPVLDLAPAFAGRATESLWVHPTDHHPNGEANAIAAQAIAKWLQARLSRTLDSSIGDRLARPVEQIHLGIAGRKAARRALEHPATDHRMRHLNSL